MMMYWLQQISNLLNQPNLYFDSLNSLNKKIITHWDSEKADKQLQALIEQYDGKLTQACRAFIEQYLLGKTIATVVGDAVVNSKSKGKLVDKMRNSKALAIARIPEILIYGKVTQTEDLNKIRNDSFVKFYTIQKRLKFHNGFKNYYVIATIKIAVRDDDEQNPYYLTASKEKPLSNNQHSESNSKNEKQGEQLFNKGNSHSLTQFDRLGNQNITKQHQRFFVLLETLMVKEI